MTLSETKKKSLKLKRFVLLEKLKNQRLLEVRSAKTVNKSYLNHASIYLVTSLTNPNASIHDVVYRSMRKIKRKKRKRESIHTGWFISLMLWSPLQVSCQQPLLCFMAWRLARRNLRSGLWLWWYHFGRMCWFLNRWRSLPQLHFLPWLSRIQTRYVTLMWSEILHVRVASKGLDRTRRRDNPQWEDL